jgi:deoxyribose-phosphate aldolase
MAANRKSSGCEACAGATRERGQTMTEKAHVELLAEVLARYEHAPNPRLREITEVVELGADEVDIVLNRSLFLGGRYAQAYDELVAAREAAGAAHLKVILETGELGSYDRVRQASMLAMAAGADFIKTSTGKIAPAATPAVILVMLEAIRDYVEETGRMVGMKPAGGIRDAKAALTTLVIVKETLGDAWLTPDLLRIGASSVLNDLLMQYAKTETGRYGRAEDFSKE